MKVLGDFLNHIEVSRFPCVGDSSLVALVVGGVHGNEPQGVKGSELLRDYLAGPENPLVTEILKLMTVYVVPVINVVGYLAGARASPKRGTEVAYEGGRVVVGEDEKGGEDRHPPNWQDPNRGWEENDTLVKHHLAWLLPVLKPSWIIFSHDWALPQARMKVYAGKEARERVLGITGICARFYPTRNAFAQSWSFIKQAREEADSGNLTWQIWKQFGIPSYLTETYFVGEDSPLAHLAFDLFLLAKIANIQGEDGEIIRTILDAVDPGGPANWWERDGFRS